MDGAVGCGFLAIVLIGWVANVVFFIGQMGSEISSSVIISGVGILAAPLGIIVGWGHILGAW